MQIDHIPNEKRSPQWIWKAIFAFVAFFWILQYRDGYDWGNIAVGLITGLFLAAWAMEKTGGEVPASWRSKTPRR